MQIRILGLQGAVSMDLVVAATAKMTAADTAAVLVKTNLAKAQQIEILMNKGLTKEEAEEKFGFLLEAFKYGTPPHGGLAFGLDRMTMLITKTDSIKDVIAFPKVQTASCVMSEAPSEVDDKQLAELYLNIVKE